MTFHFCGYFPKKVTPLPNGYDLPGVLEIASVSDCIAKGPERRRRASEGIGEALDDDEGATSDERQPEALAYSRQMTK